MIKATKHTMFLALLTIWWQAQGQFTPPFDMIIAQDGSGDFTTITEGISSAPSFCSTRFIIKLSAGIYNENILINKEKTNLTIIGEGMERTIITGSRSYDDGIKTFETATVGKSNFHSFRQEKQKTVIKGFDFFSFFKKLKYMNKVKYHAHI